jgi:hypothetical protein
MAKQAKKAKAEKQAEMTTGQLSVVPTTDNKLPDHGDYAEANVAPKAAVTPAEKPKKAKKEPNAAVRKFLAQPDLPLEKKIKILIPATENKPKTRKALIRYRLYEDGMTVGDYIEKSKKAGNTGNVASRDVRWDYTKGFIDVV